MTESVADQESTVDGGAGDVLPKHDVGDGATNQDDDQADDAPVKRPKYDASHDDDSFSVCDILAGVPEVQSVAAAQQHEEEPAPEPTTAEELPAYIRLEDIEWCNPPGDPLCDFSKVAPGAACGVAGGKALSRLIAQRVCDTLSPAFFLKFMKNVTCTFRKSCWVSS